MIRRNGISKEEKNPGASDRLEWWYIECKALEERRAANIRGGLIPAVGSPFGYLQTLPNGIPREDILVVFCEQIPLDRLFKYFSNLSLRRPQLLKIDGLSRVVESDGIVFKVDGDSSGKGPDAEWC